MSLTWSSARRPWRYCVASADVGEIDEINILQASMLAMERAVSGLNVAVDFVIVDGNRDTGVCPVRQNG